MSEFSPYLSDLNRHATPVADNEQHQWKQSERMANRWRNFLQRRQRLALSGSPKAFWTVALPRGSRAFVDWTRAAFARNSHLRRASHLENEIEGSRAELRRYVMMAQFAINLAVRQDPDPTRRMARKRTLMDRWRRLYQKPRSI